MTVGIWWVVLVAVLAFLAGIALTLVVAGFFLIDKPMDGHTFTGDLPADLRDDG